MYLIDQPVLPISPKLVPLMKSSILEVQPHRFAQHHISAPDPMLPISRWISCRSRALFSAPQRRKYLWAADGRSATQLQYLKHPGRVVNSGMLNAAARNFFLPHFCVFFRDSGRFLDSWNPVNYLFVTPLSLFS
jgi:hypothetical protein